MTKAIKDKFSKTTTTITIPDASGVEEIEIEVQRPQLINIKRDGSVIEGYEDILDKAILGKGPSNDTKIEKLEDVEKSRELMRWVEFYCKISMVNPKFDEVKENMTDDQVMSVYAWAIAPTGYLRRKNATK